MLFVSAPQDKPSTSYHRSVRRPAGAFRSPFSVLRSPVSAKGALVLDEGEEAVLVEVEEALVLEQTAQSLDKRGVFGRGGEGAFDFRAVVVGHALAEALLLVLSERMEGLGQRGLHQPHKEVEEADVPRLVHADDQGGIRVILPLQGLFGAVAHGLEGFVDERLGVGLAAQTVGVAQDTETVAVGLQERQVVLRLRAEPFQFLRGEVPGQEQPRRKGLQLTLADARLGGVIHRLGQQGVIHEGLVKGVKQPLRGTHNTRVPDGIDEVEGVRASFHACYCTIRGTCGAPENRKQKTENRAPLRGDKEMRGVGRRPTKRTKLPSLQTSKLPIMRPAGGSRPKICPNLRNLRFPYPASFHGFARRALAARSVAVEGLALRACTLRSLFSVLCVFGGALTRPTKNACPGGRLCDTIRNGKSISETT